VEQIAALHQTGMELVLVSSGAVASGRAVLTPSRKTDAVSSRQLWAALGQVKLMSRYSDFFREYGLVCAQVLLTKENFSSRAHYLNLKNCIATLLPPGREETQAMLHARGFIDLIIPRGSQGLIDFVRHNAAVPVIETGAGICHTFFDAEGETRKGAAIIFNAKTRRPSVCNALDCLIIHRDRLADLPALTNRLAEKQVVIYADPPAWQVLKGRYPAGLLLPAAADSFGTEFLSLKLAIKTADSLDEALRHIACFSSRQSEAIITENRTTAALFTGQVDAAVVYTNASTAFTDGAQFGLGAEIGINTQKLHARGPMALEALTTCKWIVEGEGQIRE
jgi:glutamate-5-semialdehyde dehydrogenase